MYDENAFFTKVKMLLEICTKWKEVRRSVK